MNRPFFFPRNGECWIGPVGLFFNSTLVGIELPNGRFVGYTRLPKYVDPFALSLPCDECNAEPGEPCRPYCIANDN